ncbi:hypothetical protein BV25DRAFT_1889207 [Artomyces pyxidatus]|uniref:Uncharacterized protein n=1 Tax=Artomyces pyxidatus TaxID=48021 RepID=A0ACB8SUJ6_9AGAM|nr:hypothetical protein BV25DRAFT_1889207 [Artomyces pyxidatus]
MFALAPLLCLLALVVPNASAARAGFSVHYPWPTRQDFPHHRRELNTYLPFCRDIKSNPQGYSGYQPSFVSFSGNAGDLVSVRYARTRVPRSRDDFPIEIATDVPIAPSGQLCFDIEMPRPVSKPEYGTFLFEARDPASGAVDYHCLDVKLLDMEALAKDHPALCARNNETLIPMPDEFL